MKLSVHGHSQWVPTYEWKTLHGKLVPEGTFGMVLDKPRNCNWFGVMNKNSQIVRVLVNETPCWVFVSDLWPLVEFRST